jgi:MOSC domain-containing protein YiiM
MTLTVDAVLIGHIAPFRDQTSAIGKIPVAGPLAVGRLGIQGDAQADLSVHGGIDKAIHHYPRDHYPFWRERVERFPDKPGTFGENISTVGIGENEACIGDRYRLGSAIVEISQGRQPCWKQGYRLGNPDVVATMVATSRCGWYYRVVEAGQVAAGDGLDLVSRPHPDWSVARVIRLLIGGGGKKERAAAAALARMEILSANWRARASAIAG